MMWSDTWYNTLIYAVKIWWCAVWWPVASVRGLCCCSLHGDSSVSKVKHHMPSAQWYLSSKLCGITSQKTSVQPMLQEPAVYSIVMAVNWFKYSNLLVLETSIQVPRESSQFYMEIISPPVEPLSGLNHPEEPCENLYTETREVDGAEIGSLFCCSRVVVVVVINHLCFKELYFSFACWYFVHHRVSTRSIFLIHLDHLFPSVVQMAEGLLWDEYEFKVAIICYSSESEGVVGKRKARWVIHIEEYLKCFVCVGCQCEAEVQKCMGIL